MNAKHLDDLLRQFSDSPNEYDRQGDVIQFMRRGREHTVLISRQPGGGLCIQGEGDDANAWLPAPVYVQQRLLDLPGLAQQIIRSLRDDPAVTANFIRGPAQLDGDDVDATECLARQLTSPPIDATRVVLIMARAGQGKTVLLQNLALGQATNYIPEVNPIPLLLNVDLVGRYVGTIDDAIAGTLNKSLKFPMTHGDVMASLRQGWMGITLDGFDELTARVGPRDAFLRISELISELKGAGVVFLSAREAFFEQHRITHAIRSYFNPRSGNYESLVLSLRDWSEKEALELFRRFSIVDPEKALAHILGRFSGTKDLVLQPFFLARLAKLWLHGESFGDTSTAGGELGTIEYAIDAILQREAVEKWRARDGEPLLTLDEHRTFLAAIAGEMWSTSAFKLDAEEIAIVCDMAAQAAGIDSNRTTDAKTRFPSHALMATVGQHSGFAHEKFFRFFLGLHLAAAVAAANTAQVESALRAQELSGETADWVAWLGRRRGVNPARSSGCICAVALRAADDQTLRANAGLLLSRILEGASNTEVAGVVFSGNMLAGRRFENLVLRECVFAQCDLIATQLEQCQIVNCEIQGVVVDHTTRLGAEVVDCRLSSAQVSDAITFDPEAVAQVLRERGAQVRNSKPSPPPLRQVDPDDLKLASKISRLGDRRAEFTIDEAVENLGKRAEHMLRHAIACQVVSQPRTRPSKGRQRQFVRFLVDRNEFLRGSTQRVSSSAIERFWSELS